MERLFTQEEVWQAIAPMKREGKTIAFVPTMGALHDGHLQLIRQAKASADHVVVSDFVNPTQFGPREDYANYPRDVVHDLEMASAEGVDIMFTPSPEAIYREGHSTLVEVGPMGRVLCGVTRPGHFAGVATIVTKLFNIVQPDIAFFGEKDYQQLQMVKRLAADLDFPVRVVGVPIVRDPDGLALSTRNQYLSAEERAAALSLYRGLAAAQALVADGERDATKVVEVISRELAAEQLVDIEYAAVVHPTTLCLLDKLDGPARALVAAKVGKARLIDNIQLTP